MLKRQMCYCSKSNTSKAVAYQTLRKYLMERVLLGDTIHLFFGGGGSQPTNDVTWLNLVIARFFQHPSAFPRRECSGLFFWRRYIVFC